MTGGPDSNPAARLPYSWYIGDEFVPSNADYDMSGKTYRYFDQQQLADAILYPFGFGLSFSRFRYIDFQVPREISNVDSLESFNATITLRNEGPFDGLFLSPSCI